MFGTHALFYVVAGAAFLGMTMMHLFSRPKLPSIPMLYIGAGAALAFTPLSAFVLDPRGSDGHLAVVEYASEVIVIIAIAGAGLAIDRPIGLRAWRHVWLLLGITMPLTMLGLVWMGMAFTGLSLASAVLLAAVLAPTDPVLARSVQVEGPNEGDESDVRVALTAEAGLNDGLAFPFVYLAIALAAVEAGQAGPGWLTEWLGFDVAYRLAVGLVLGWGTGRVLGHFVHGPHGDAQRGASDAGMVMIGTTFLAYGLAEAVESYGFLAVFFAARAGRRHSSQKGESEYIEHPHRFSDQFEKGILALFLLWLGGYVVSGGMAGLRWSEVAVAALLIFALRPLAGMVAMAPLTGPRLQRFAIGAFGIRGLGTLFYIAYGAGAATFEGIDAVWRIALAAILLSVFVHGVLAPITMREIDRREGAA